MRFTSSATILSLCAASVTAQLNAAMVSRGRSYIGTAVTTTRNDNRELNIIGNRNEIGSITPENAQKWNQIEPNRGQFNYGEADVIADYAVANGKYLRCQTLIWDEQLPRWVTDGNFNNQTLLSIMEQHIVNVVGRYKGKCNSWDVVNAALNNDGTYKNNVFYRTVGEIYIPLSFWAVSQVDPQAKLYYNDYNLEFNNNKTAAVVRLVQLIRSYGIKIDGIGFQGHLVANQNNRSNSGTPEVNTLTSSLRRFTDLGLEVAYTQTDVRIQTPANREKLQQQAAAYTRIVQSCMQVSRCVGISFWGLSDRYSWVNNAESLRGQGNPLLYDDDFNRKPAYQAVLDAINRG